MFQYYAFVLLLCIDTSLNTSRYKRIRQKDKCVEILYWSKYNVQQYEQYVVTSYSVNTNNLVTKTSGF